MGCGFSRDLRIHEFREAGAVALIPLRHELESGPNVWFGTNEDPTGSAVPRRACWLEQIHFTARGHHDHGPHRPARTAEDSRDRECVHRDRIARDPHLRANGSRRRGQGGRRDAPRTEPARVPQRPDRAGRGGCDARRRREAQHLHGRLQLGRTRTTRWQPRKRCSAIRTRSRRAHSSAWRRSGFPTSSSRSTPLPLSEPTRRHDDVTD